MAASLCAELIVPPPCEMLNDFSHLDGKLVSCGHTWTDFINITLANGDQAFSEKNFINRRIISYSDFAITISGTGYAEFGQVFASFYNSVSFVWIINDKLFNWMENFNSFSDANLITPTPYMTWSDHNANIETNFCSVDVGYSDLVIKLSEEILLNHDAIASNFFTFHIRRGDSKTECDTSLEKIQRYLDCSLSSCSKTTLLVFSDETDLFYWDKVEEFIQDLGHTFLNGEKLIRKVLQDLIELDKLQHFYLNNQFIFQISNYIKELSESRLVQRRSFKCNDCDKVCL